MVRRVGKLLRRSLVEFLHGSVVGSSVSSWSLPARGFSSRSSTNHGIWDLCKTRAWGGNQQSVKLSNCFSASLGLSVVCRNSTLSRSVASNWPSKKAYMRFRRERMVRKSTNMYNANNVYVTALINSLNAMQPATHWTRLVPLLMAQLGMSGRNAIAWCYSTPANQHMNKTYKNDEMISGKRPDLAIKNMILNVLRLFWLWVLFSPVVLTTPIVVWGNKNKRKIWMRLLRRTLEISGPAFIKWGQWAATRADLFPRDMCQELEKLHADAPAHDYAVTAKTIEESFGFPLEVLFSEFDTSPVASGSIGQVHRATVSPVTSRLTGMDEGALVAVKVRHPGVTESIHRDFALMTAVVRILCHLPALRDLRLEESLKQFAAPLQEQVDLSREGFYLHAFNYNFRKESSVGFPVPLYPLVSEAVLVETFEPGEHISSYVAKGAGSPHNTELAQIGARTMLHMLIVDNLVHSDLHPGNILVNLKPIGGTFGMTVWNSLIKFMGACGVDLDINTFLKPSVVLLDAGMCTELSQEDQVNMVGLFESFSRLDARDIADWTLRFAGDDQMCVDPDGFRADLATAFDEMRRKRLFDKGNTSSGAEALAAVLEMVRLHRVSLPGHICATVVTTLVLEGWSHRLDPAHSTLNEVKRIISLKKGETKARKAAMWIQQAAVEREILEHVPPIIAAEHNNKFHL